MDSENELARQTIAPSSGDAIPLRDLKTSGLPKAREADLRPDRYESHVSPLEGHLAATTTRHRALRLADGQSALSLTSIAGNRRTHSSMRPARDQPS